MLESRTDSAHLHEARDVLRKAAIRLAAISPLNAWRLKQLGFELD